MRAPSVAALLAAFRDLDRPGALLIRKLARAASDRDALATLIERSCPDTHAYRRRCYHDPLASYAGPSWPITVALHAIDRALGTYGVEPLGPVDYRNGPPFEYCNAGDTYATTLIYDRARDCLTIGSWGDIVERDPRFAGARDDDDDGRALSGEVY